MEKSGESVPWIDEMSTASTSSPETVEEAAVGTLVIIIISAILSITFLFALAVFIDCRHQKLAKLKQKQIPKKILRISLPGFSARRHEDQETIVNNMHADEDTSSPVVAVIV